MLQEKHKNTWSFEFFHVYILLTAKSLTLAFLSERKIERYGLDHGPGSHGSTELCTRMSFNRSGALGNCSDSHGVPVH
jgi:hypothetical protein